jgi:hypothetical protein
MKAVEIPGGMEGRGLLVRESAGAGQGAVRGGGSGEGRENSMSDEEGSADRLRADERTADGRETRLA